MHKARIQRIAFAVAMVLGVVGGGGGAQAGLINGGFETVIGGVPADSYTITNQANVPGWRTTSSDGAIEIWDSGFSSISGGPVPSYEGQQFAEINATQFATLFQDSTGVAAGSVVGFQFAHRGRAGLDVMRLTITDLGNDNLPGGGNDTILFTRQYSDSQAWGFYTNAGEPIITAIGNTVRFEYQAISTASGDSTIGNFIDAADFGVGVGAAPAPEPATALLLSLGLGFLGRRMLASRC